jgi:hypothetical protein
MPSDSFDSESPEPTGTPTATDEEIARWEGEGGAIYEIQIKQVLTQILDVAGTSSTE